MYISTYNGMTLYMYIVGGSESEIYMYIIHVILHVHAYTCINAYTTMITNIQVLVYMKIVIMIHVHVATVHQRFLITRTIGPKSFLFGTTEFSLWARWHS